MQLAARVHRSRAPLGMLLRAETNTVAGMSMELGLGWDRATGTLETRPIKGTRPRGRDEAEDAAMREQLASDPKERAENVMAVDVHRNDLGRVARVGTVRVPALCEVESHAFVHHLVSTVRATVRDDASLDEVIDAVFPLGSVTGAPKRAAMTKIAQLEPEQRGIYTGVYGSIGRDGSMRLAVAIRTAVSDPRGTHYGVGGGIVVDSDPAREWEELMWKERAFAGR
jgi:anthranilate/para-aminobenzoate synthase component I